MGEGLATGKSTESLTATPKVRRLGHLLTKDRNPGGEPSPIPE